MNAVKTADLNLLVIFDAIMREGSITRAAERKRKSTGIVDELLLAQGLDRRVAMT